MAWEILVYEAGGRYYSIAYGEKSHASIERDLPDDWIFIRMKREIPDGKVKGLYALIKDLTNKLNNGARMHIEKELEKIFSE